MSRYIIRRLLGMIPLLLGISFIVFALLNLVPGSPISQFEFNPNIKPADLERIQHNLGLDQPWYLRYFTWLGGALHGDFGISFINYVPVTRTLSTALPNTLLLSMSSLLVAIVFSIPVGVYAAINRNSLFDRFTNFFATAFYSMPSIWLGMLLIILFSVKFQQWGLPSMPVAGVKNLRGGGDVWDRFVHLVMPMMTLALISLAGWTRYIRSQMLEVIRQDYIRTADAKGLTKRLTIQRHAFKNAVLPLVTLIGLDIPNLFGGAVIVERVFGYRGIGLVTLESLQTNDYSVAMACIMMLAFLTVIGNLLADIMYGVLDPRVRYD
ncbi:MAG TPA: ABC transporter permease [Thermomicrobiales bacterium]|nr:ABC transporter permease [Thermomicrobiales bacterium]